MSEYGMTPRQYFHSLTPSQIEALEKAIIRRKLVAARDQVFAFNVADPERYIRDIEQQIREMQPVDPSEYFKPFSEAQKEMLNIHIEKPNP